MRFPSSYRTSREPFRHPPTPSSDDTVPPLDLSDLSHIGTSYPELFLPISCQILSSFCPVQTASQTSVTNSSPPSTFSHSLPPRTDMLYEVERAESSYLALAEEM